MFMGEIMRKIAVISEILCLVLLCGCGPAKESSGEKQSGTGEKIQAENGEQKSAEQKHTGQDNISVEKEILQEKISEKLNVMTLEEKAAQLFIITPEALTGEEKVTRADEVTKAALEKYPVGGLIFFEENIVSEEQLRDMISCQQAYAKERIGIPLLIGVDEEGGSVARIASCEAIEVPKIRDMSEIGESGDVAEAYKTGDTIGSYLNRMGFNLDFAPVADVLTNSDNTVVKKRSFGSDPQLTAEMVVSELAGLEKHQVYGCVKHFPGHGATSGDTHNGYAYTDKNWTELRENEIIPFQRAIDEGVPFVMVGHISTPQITGNEIAASCSEKMIEEYLRKELGYQGVVLTDALNMKAVTEQYTSAEAAVKVIQAGGDMLLMPENFEEAYNGILSAVKEGRISENRLNEAVERILRVKIRLSSEKKE